MKSERRERVLKAVNHREQDGVPVDFGGTSVTGIHISSMEKLREYYGLEKRKIKLCEPYQCLGEMDEDLKEKLGVDVEGVASISNMYGVENTDWVDWTTPWGQDVLIPRDFHLTKNPDGSVYAYPCGDTSVPPSGKMPEGGCFFDAIIRQEELPEEDDDLKLEDNLEEFTLLSDRDLAKIKRNVHAAFQTGRAVIGAFGGTALGDIAMVPAMNLKHPKGIRDITEWYVSTAIRQGFIRKIFDREVEIGIRNLERINAACGDEIDIVFTCGTDFGTQNGTFCSVDTFRTLYAPFYKRLNDWIHAHTKWKIFKHSCGSCIDFIPSFIDCGFDILNPVQCSARGMDPRVLKREFGADITFWGGGVDTQMVLPFGTPEEVRRQVLERCEIFSKGGGYVFNTIHNLQAKVPVENMVAMIEAYQEFNEGR